MKPPTKRFILFAWAGALYLIGQYLRGVWFEHIPWLCYYKENAQGAYCNWPSFDSGLALIVAGQLFAIVGVIMFFANAKAWKKWLIMSLLYLPLATYSAINFTTGSLMFGPEHHETELLTWVFGILYIFITLFIVLWSHWRGPKAA